MFMILCVIGNIGIVISIASIRGQYGLSELGMGIGIGIILNTILFGLDQLRGHVR